MAKVQHLQVDGAPRRPSRIEELNAAWNALPEEQKVRAVTSVSSREHIHFIRDTKDPSSIIGTVSRVAGNRWKWAIYAKPFKLGGRAKTEPKVKACGYHKQRHTALFQAQCAI